MKHRSKVGPGIALKILGGKQSTEVAKIETGKTRKSKGAFMVIPEAPSDYLAKAKRFVEPVELVSVGEDRLGRAAYLATGAAAAWVAMRAAAGAEGVVLELVSAFRSEARQRELVVQKLMRGMTLEEILRVNAYPGYSEHHSGRAIDVTSPGVTPLSVEFAATGAFAWLRARAAAFRFHLSYPEGNAEGYIYEPWHWCYRE